MNPEWEGPRLALSQIFLDFLERLCYNAQGKL